MSSPQSSPKRSPTRSPKRKILHERTQSQTNEISLRLVKDDVDRKPEPNYYAASPYPTKPTQILRPSQIRGRQGSPFQEEHDVSDAGLPVPLLEHVNKNKGKGRAFSNAPSSRSPSVEARTLSLNRSVAALREHFESQASTPIAPLSPQVTGPQTPRERPRGLDTFFQIASSEDVIILPGAATSQTNLLRSWKSDESLPTIQASPRQSRESQRSHTLHDSTPDLSSSSEDSSSPNVVRLGAPSSSNQAGYDTSTPEAAPDDESSSPNITQLQRSSSPFPRLVDVSSRSSSPNLLQLGSSSSPNVIRVGNSSPSSNYITVKTSGSDESSNSDETVIKQQQAREIPSFSTFPTSATRFSSSPPERHLHTYPSTSSFASSDLDSTSERSGSIASHSDLQAIIESSPAPSIQYPVVRAPAPSTWAELTVPKRPPRVMPARGSGQWDPHLSTIPSEWSAERQHSNRPSMAVGEEEDNPDLPELPRPPFLRSRDASYATNATVRIVSLQDQNEAEDYVSDLRSMSLRGKASGFFSIVSSNTDSRQDSIRSSLRRPSSGGSLRNSLPGWARRYYSLGGSSLAVGMLPTRDSYHSSQLQISESTSHLPTSSASQVTEHFPLGIFRPRTRPRNIQTQSAFEVDRGPLTSHPTPVDEFSSHRRHTQPPERPRPKSIPLDPADPRSHWAAAAQAALEQELLDLESHLRQSRIANEWSPHLFHDVRVEKDGRARRHRWRAASLNSLGSGEKVYGRRNLQVWGFCIGFVFPLAWFVAAFLPLPKRANLDFMEGEEGVPATETHPRNSTIRATPRTSLRASRQDLEAQIRQEQKMAVVDEIRYENARWWRNLNRGMCAVGVVVIVLMVVLAVLGTRTGGFS